MVGATGFEPAIFRSQSGRDTRLRYAPNFNCKLRIANCELLMSALILSIRRSISNSQSSICNFYFGCFFASAR
jgi:hypothetical protein